MKKKITLQNRWNGKANVYVRDRQPTADHGVRNGTAYGVGAKAITNSLNWRGIYSFQLWLFWVNESRRGRTKDRSRIMNKVVAAAAKSGNAELFYSLSFAICSTLFTHFSSLSLLGFVYFVFGIDGFLLYRRWLHVKKGLFWKDEAHTTLSGVKQAIAKVLLCLFLFLFLRFSVSAEFAVVVAFEGFG